MTIDAHAPVVVGVGQVLGETDTGAQPREPAELIAQALLEAGRDSGTGERLLRAADSIRCVPVIGWHYPDLGSLLASELGASPRETVQSATFGGDGPQALLNDAAAEIAAGRLEVALIAGGDCGASVKAARQAGRELRWRVQDEALAPTRVLEADRPPVNDAEMAAGLAPPVYMYALIESAVRATAGRSSAEHLRAISGLWSRFSRVAAANEHAWIRRGFTPEQIALAAPGNRMISTPYTKLLTANIQVDMASGLILASASAAEQAGVPRDRWVFVHAGARAHDEWHVSERESLSSSPAIRAVGRAAVEHAGVAIDEIAHIDLYSCFPSAVQIAARELGLALDDPSRPLTVTGGLTFAGGPGNNYAGHSIATLVERLREQPDSYGLTTALGWYATKHAIGVYSSRPPRRLFADLRPHPGHRQRRRALCEHGAQATVEAYTVPHDRDEEPSAAIISAIGPTGERVIARTADPDAVRALLAEDRIGHPVQIREGRVSLAG